MNGCHNPPGEFAREQLPSLRHQLELRAEHRLSRRSPEADDYIRLDDAQFGFEPGATGLHFGHAWFLVNAALASRFPLEVLDRVGEVDRVARDSRFRECLVEQRARGTDERLSLSVLLISRL